MPKPPLNLDTFNVTKKIEKFQSIELTLPSANIYYQKALLKLAEKVREMKNPQFIEIVNQLINNKENYFNVEVSPQGYIKPPSTLQMVKKGQKQLSYA